MIICGAYRTCKLCGDRFPTKHHTTRELLFTTKGLYCNKTGNQQIFIPITEFQWKMLVKAGVVEENK